MKESLKVFNSLEAYNFYMSGQAQDTAAVLQKLHIYLFPYHSNKSINQEKCWRTFFSRI